MIQKDLKIFSICETDLSDFDEKKPFSFQGYETLWPKKQPGDRYYRLLTFIARDVSYVRRNDLENSLLPTIWIELRSAQGKKILLAFIYREFQCLKEKPFEEEDMHGSNVCTQLLRLKSFGSQLSIACAETERVIVLGDFNINIQKKGDENYYLQKLLQEYEAMMGENGLSFKRMGTTFERVHMDGRIIQSEIDHLILNCPNEVKEFGTFPFDSSDHKGIMAEINFETSKPEKKTVTSRDLRNVRKNPKILKDSVAKINWYQLLGMEDVNDMVEFWSSQMNAALDQVAPLKQRVLRDGKRKPNLGPEVLQKIQEKKNLKSKVQESIALGKFDGNLLEEYKKCRNQCSNMIRASHRIQTGTNITEETSLNEMWKIVNSMLSPKERAKLTLKVKGPIKGSYDDPELVANELNNWFKEKVEGLIIKIDKTKLQDPFIRLREKLKDRVLKFSLQPADVHQVLKVLKDLKKKTSCGLDGISSEMLKECKEEMAGPLTIIINRSICSGVFPKNWKVAKIAPLLKKGDATKRENYRPVALLCVAAMVLEKIVADQIEKYFESNKLLGEFQFGFRKNKSTISELITLFETLNEAKEENKLILQILYDLSAAFDTVEPRVIVEKLKVYGFDSISSKWMESYLTKRSQRTMVGGKLSEPVDLCYGTPQGSRLSPLLFSILMADLDLWTADSKLSNFADDTQSVIISDNEENLRYLAKREAQAVVDHFSANNLVNNANKAALLYNNKGKAETICIPIAGENLKSKESEKLLGVQVASDLSWKYHIDYICSKMNQRLGILRRLKNKVPQDKLRIIAGAIFTSVARYGIAVYSKPRLHSDPLKEDLHRLQVIQNKMFRLLAGKSLLDKVRVEDLGKKFNMMSINQMTCYHTLTETFNIINYGASEKIQTKLLPKSDTSTHLTIPLCKKTSCRGFSFYSSRLWEQLPVEIRVKAMPKAFINNTKGEKLRQNTFKKEVKKWIWNGGVPFK